MRRLALLLLVLGLILLLAALCRPSRDAFSARAVGTPASAATCSSPTTGALIAVGEGITWGAADTLTLCAKPGGLDATLVARLTNCKSTGPYGWECALTVRQSTDPAAPHADCVFSDAGTYAEWRPTAGAQTQSSALGPNLLSG